MKKQSQGFASRKVTPVEALETAYWLHWCGDYEFARKMLIRITNQYLEGEANGQGEQTISLW